MAVVALERPALTPWAAIHVPHAVLKDIEETENIVEVRQLSRFCSAMFVYNVWQILYVYVSLQYQP